MCLGLLGGRVTAGIWNADTGICNFMDEHYGVVVKELELFPGFVLATVG